MVSSNFLWAMFWLALCLAVLGAAWVIFRRVGARLKPDHEDQVPLRWLRKVLALLAVVVVAGFAIGLWPYKWEYHSYQQVAGNVADISARFRVDGQATSQSFAIRFQGRSQIYRCDDTRCALIKPGDRLVLRCIREYQWASVSGYGCVFVRYISAT